MNDAALGAGSGLLVAGPVGLVAGGVIGYVAGPNIGHGTMSFILLLSRDRMKSKLSWHAILA